MRLCKLFFAVVFLCIAGPATAQTGCYDQFLINENAFCNTDFEPVCGCDGVTYKNECFARNYFGISYSTFGPCSNIAFDLRPNPVRDFLEINIVLKFKAFTQIIIYDMQGNIQYRRNLGNIERFELTLPLTGLNNGLYLFFVESGGVYEYQRFIKL